MKNFYVTDNVNQVRADATAADRLSATRQVRTEPVESGTRDAKWNMQAFQEYRMVNRIERSRKIKQSQYGSVATVDGLKKVWENFDDGRFGRVTCVKARLLRRK